MKQKDIALERKLARIRAVMLFVVGGIVQRIDQACEAVVGIVLIKIVVMLFDAAGPVQLRVDRAGIVLLLFQPPAIACLH